MTVEEMVAAAKEVADKIRPIAPEKAAEIDKAIEDLLAGRRDSLKVDAKIHYKLEKFDGEIEPGKEPVEVIEGEG